MDENIDLEAVLTAQQEAIARLTAERDEARAKLAKHEEIVKRVLDGANVRRADKETEARDAFIASCKL